MSGALLIELAWKSAACAGLTLLLLAMMRNRSAAQKSLVAHLGILLLTLLPVGTALLPEIKIAAPVSLSQAYSAASGKAGGAVAGAEGSSAPVHTETGIELMQPLTWQSILLFGYGVPAGLLLLLTAAAVARLQLLRFRSQVVVDPAWLTALASAQHRLGLKHGTALLTSPELRSPVSWGIVRPIIIIDPEVARESDRAEAIIAHELAHVARLDWLALILGRVVIAL
jgi:beta-lactamase regulating signal transducer with metallopeptidase domain